MVRNYINLYGFLSIRQHIHPNIRLKQVSESSPLEVLLPVRLVVSPGVLAKLRIAPSPDYQGDTEGLLERNAVIGLVE